MGIDHKFTQKTLGFNVLKETFGPEDLKGIERNGEPIPEDKLANVYSNIRNSPRFPGTCFIFNDTLDAILNEMSEADKKKRALEIRKLMLDPKNFMGDYTVKDRNGNYATNERLQKVVELERELTKLGY